MTARVFALSLTLISAVLAQQTGAIEGRVTNAKTGEPVRRVTVTLRQVLASGQDAANMLAPYVVGTNAEGKFRIERIAPGSYRLMADRPGLERCARFDDSRDIRRGV